MLRQRDPGLHAYGGPRLLTVAGILSVSALISAGFAMDPPGGQDQLNTSLEDFQLLGTQPDSDSYEFTPFYSHQNCMFCHGDYDIEVAPVDTWVVSLKAQSGRDPVFKAGLTIANQDANIAGNFCLRCHAPTQFYREAADNGELNEMSTEDMDGITCTLCHRVVNPTYGPDSAVGYPGDPADPDQPIISDLLAENLLPNSLGNAQLVLDPFNTRRAQYDDVPENYHGVDQHGEEIRLITSPYHEQSQFCGSCHDVGNPLFHKGEER